MKYYNNLPLLDTLDELKINPQSITPTTSLLKRGDDLYQVFLPVVLTQHKGYLIKVPEIDEKLITEDFTG